MYIAGLEALRRIAGHLAWDKRQFEAALKELIRQLKPTLAEI
jgi:hypothetical protein